MTKYFLQVLIKLGSVLYLWLPSDDLCCSEIWDMKATMVHLIKLVWILVTVSVDDVIGDTGKYSLQTCMFPVYTKYKLSVCILKDFTSSRQKENDICMFYADV